MALSYTSLLFTMLHLDTQKNKVCYNFEGGRNYIYKATTKLLGFVLLSTNRA